jgi:hypothetical protein
MACRGGHGLNPRRAARRAALNDVQSITPFRRPRSDLQTVEKASAKNGRKRALLIATVIASFLTSLFFAHLRILRARWDGMMLSGDDHRRRRRWTKPA